MTTIEDVMGRARELEIEAQNFTRAPRDKYVKEALVQERLNLRAAIEQYAAERVAGCKGISDPKCNYLANCQMPCNKCGRLHAHHMMIARAGEYERLTAERDELQAKLDAAEPVAMRYISGTGKRWRYLNYPYAKGWDFPASLGMPQPLYAAPPDFDALQRKHDALMMECCKRCVF